MSFEIARLVLSVAVVCLIGGCGDRSGAHLQSSLRFEPNAIDMRGRPLGRHEYQVRLVNATARPLTKIQLYTTCGCIEVLEPKSSFVLAPQGDVSVRFALTEPSPIDVDQAIFARAWSEREEPAELSIRGRLSAPFDIGPVRDGIQFRRLVTGGDAESVKVQLSVSPDCTVTAIKVHSSQVAMGWRQVGRKLAIECRPGASLADGKGLVTVAAEYRSGDQSGVFEFMLPILVKSQFRVAPDDLWFGKVFPDVPSHQRLVISGPDAASRVKVSSRSGSLRVVSKGDGETLVVDCSLTPPRKQGLLSERITIAVDGKPRGGVTASALVVHPHIGASRGK